MSLFFAYNTAAPLKPPILWEEKLAKSILSRLTLNFGNDWTISEKIRIFLSLALILAEISSISLMAPVSLLICIIQTRAVLLSIKSTISLKVT